VCEAAEVARRRTLLDGAVTRIEGPWTSRDVITNGVRLHVVEAGTGPLVLLVHGFPQFWWAWRHQIPDLVGAGYRVVAVDLRGYAASDKPPRGYDAPTLAADLAKLVPALGERRAVVVGHDWGGHLGWTMATLHPEVVRKLVVMSIPHPLCWPRELLRSRHQRRASRYIARFQLPWHPERWLVEDDAANVARLLRDWGGPGFPDAATERRYRDAMQVGYAPNRELEYYRWAVRSVPRTDGRRYRKAMRTAVDVPTLQIQGSLDRCILPATAKASRRWAAGDYEWLELDGVGHFPHEEAPDAVSEAIARWAVL
jgi:pimeloyl-ACP methyl ester carboxylesterase